MTLLDAKIIMHTVFDAYGTIFDVHSATSRYQSKLGEKAYPVSELWRRKQLEYTWLRSLMVNYVDFRQVTRDALDFAFDENGISDNRLKEELLNSYLYLDCYSEVPKFLKSLKNYSFSMSILSNGTREMLEKAIRNCSLEKFFDEIFSVDTIEVFNPDPKVYKYPVNKLGCDPKEILFFSTNSWDISGASSFGYQTVWVNRFQQKPDILPGETLLEINNLKDVFNFIV
tara:strand:+ start:1576 stop:2259 length:684 start_codon:yes stop_codon:yes gene_type:complete